MLERLIVSHHNASGELDLGLLAEQLLYYGQVHVLAGPGQLTSLIDKLGGDLVLALLKSPWIVFHYYEDTFAIQTQGDIHRPITFLTWKKDRSGLALAPDRIVSQALERKHREPRKRLRRSPELTLSCSPRMDR
ncbi:MAG: hypothetical protein IT381_32870 [Deltaproteobacteria bacterium]|nr:hypothetical protein [Deltaproteobacteria bacterium]